MIECIRRNDNYEYKVTDTLGKSYFRLIPQRGGIITNLCLDEVEILYFDRELFEKKDITAGGNPLLFPTCGSLNNDTYVYNSSDYKMNCHGFAWEMPWKVVNRNDELNSIKIELRSNAHTLEMFPFDFEANITYSIEGKELLIIQKVHNYSKCNMPLYFGIHPFFNVSDKNLLKFDINSGKYVDYNNLKVFDFSGNIDFKKPVDHVFYLDGSGEKRYSMHDPYKGTIYIESSKEYKNLVIWTEPNKKFVCMEPWMAAPDALNTKEGLEIVSPGSCLETWIKITHEWN